MPPPAPTRATTSPIGITSATKVRSSSKEFRYQPANLKTHFFTRSWYPFPPISSPKQAANSFFEIRDELLKGMHDSERSDLPIYLSQKFSKRAGPLLLRESNLS